MPAAAIYVVAIVDDDNRIIASLGSLLESAGYDVRLYSSAEKLLGNDSLIKELDCLISDIDMPVVDGFELRRAAKSVKPGLPVILITARSDLAAQARTSGLPADRLFMKPFDGSDLLSAVGKAVGAPPQY